LPITSSIAFGSAPRGWRAPRLALLVLLRRQAHAEHAAAALGHLHCSFDRLTTEPADAREEGPLIRPGLESVIEKDAVALVARRFLQRQGDQVAEASLRHRILAREEPVVRVETQLGPPLHGLREHMRPEPPGERRR